MIRWFYDLWAVNTDLGRAGLIIATVFIPVTIMSFTLAIIMVRDRNRRRAKTAEALRADNERLREELRIARMHPYGAAINGNREAR